MAEYYQRQAYETLNEIGDIQKEKQAEQKKAFIQQLRDAGKEKEISTWLKSWQASQEDKQITVPYEVAWCEGELFDNYNAEALHIISFRL